MYVAGKQVAETHRLSATLDAKAIGDGPITVVACDLYDNASKPSRPVR